MGSRKSQLPINEDINNDAVITVTLPSIDKDNNENNKNQSDQKHGGNNATVLQSYNVKNVQYKRNKAVSELILPNDTASVLLPIDTDPIKHEKMSSSQTKQHTYRPSLFNGIYGSFTRQHNFMECKSAQKIKNINDFDSINSTKNYMSTTATKSTQHQPIPQYINQKLLKLEHTAKKEDEIKQVSIFKRIRDGYYQSSITYKVSSANGIIAMVEELHELKTPEVEYSDNLLYHHMKSIGEFAGFDPKLFFYNSQPFYAKNNVPFKSDSIARDGSQNGGCIAIIPVGVEYLLVVSFNKNDMSVFCSFADLCDNISDNSYM